MSTLLSVQDLCVSLRIGRRAHQVVDDVSLDVAAGQILCLVGESGSGKSMTAKALMGLLPGSAKATGRARLDDADLLDPRVVKAVRGRDMGMIFQEPMTALNPVLTVGRQMTEASVVLGRMTQAQANQRAIALLDSVGLNGGASRLRQYPHEFSGGMRQRVLIAMTLMSAPRLMIADEPTTALDVTVQSQILQLLKSLVRDRDMGLLLITHDMGVVAEVADRVAVMQNGSVVEAADVHTLFASPTEPYSQALLAAVPRLDVGDRNNNDTLADRKTSDPLVKVHAVSKSFSSGISWLPSYSRTQALDSVSFSLHKGEVVALVGESGSGKSTLGRAVARLVDIDAGTIHVDGQDVSTLAGAQLRKARARTQMIFQDPYSSLDPRFSIGRTVAEPLVIQGTSTAESLERAAALLSRVGLSDAMMARYPHEFSGGQRQRIAIARALASEPSVVIADEPTSALDVSIQAQVLELLESLKVEHSLALLFISHDLAVVGSIADRIVVMRRGRVVETGPTDRVLNHPEHLYTQLLIQSAPVPDPSRRSCTLTAPKELPADDDGSMREVVPGHWVMT